MAFCVFELSNTVDCSRQANIFSRPTTYWVFAPSAMPPHESSPYVLDMILAVQLAGDSDTTQKLPEPVGKAALLPSVGDVLGCPVGTDEG